MGNINLTPYIIIGYFAGVIIIGILSLITIAILFKHAEKRSVAAAISTAYGVLFAVLFATSLTAFI
jgi:hypothetical protein